MWIGQVSFCLVALHLQKCEHIDALLCYLFFFPVERNTCSRRSRSYFLSAMLFGWIKGRRYIKYLTSTIIQCTIYLYPSFSLKKKTSNTLWFHKTRQWNIPIINVLMRKSSIQGEKKGEFPSKFDMFDYHLGKLFHQRNGIHWYPVTWTHEDTSWCRTTAPRQTLGSGSRKPLTVTACRICL